MTRFLILAAFAMSLVVMGGCGGGDDDLTPEEAAKKAEAAAKDLGDQIQKAIDSADFDEAEKKIKELKDLDNLPEEWKTKAENLDKALELKKKAKEALDALNG